MNTPETETRFRFVVASADEAVKVLRDRLGEHARVVSVRQIEGSGLSRFLTTPKLEIIATTDPVPLPEAEPLVARPAPEPAPTLDSEPVVAADGPTSLERVLRGSGLGPSMLARLQALPEWKKLTARPLGPALREVALILRILYGHGPAAPLGPCVAFVGTPGVGKTSALCKRLSADVFLRRQRAHVMKLDIDKANPSDGLAVFCDALGVPLLRESDLFEWSEGETMYVDVPGVNPGNEAEIAQLQSVLSREKVTRVLVVNACYDTSLIKRAYQLGERLEATHVVFTHLDELTHWGKLWEFILDRKLTPLFLSTGQNIAGDFEEHVLSAIMAETFPETGSEAAKEHAAA